MATIPADVHKQVAELVEQAETANLVPNVKKIFAVLAEHGLLYEMKIAPRFVGVHPANRDGYGVNAHDCHCLLANIFAIGFDKDEVRAVCVEIGDQGSIVEFNLQLVAESGGLLAPVEKASLRYSSLWGGHTNQALRIAAAGLHHQDQTMTVDGRLNLEKIGAKDPQLRTACLEGVMWQVIQADVLRTWPGLAQAVQAAGNAAGQVAHGEHEFQVLRKIEHKFNALGGSALAKFSDVKAYVLRSRPGCASSLPGMYGFFLRCGGGKDAPLLRDTEVFVRAQAPTSRIVSADLWDALSMDFKGTQQAVRFKHAILKLAYTCQASITNNECKIVTAGDVRRCGSKELLPKVLAAEALINEVRYLVATHGLAHCPKARIALGKLEANLVLHVLDKKHKELQQFDTMSAVAHHGLEALCAECKVNIPSMWAATSGPSTTDEKAKKPKTASQEVAMRSLDSDGKLEDSASLVVEKGFAVGMSVMRRADKSVGLIESISEKVLLRTPDGTQLFASLESFLRGEWVDHNPRPEAKPLEQWLQHAPHASLEFAIAIAKATATEELSELSTKHSSILAHIDLYAKPRRAVHATKDFGNNKLILVPATLRIEAMRSDLPCSSGAVSIGSLLKSHKDLTFYLLPSLALPSKGKGLLAPFWFVQATQVESEANMELYMPKATTGSSDTKVKIPLLRNIVNIEAGDALIVFEAKKTPMVEELEEITPAASAPKKQKKQ